MNKEMLREGNNWEEEQEIQENICFSCLKFVHFVYHYVLACSVVVVVVVEKHQIQVLNGSFCNYMKEEQVIICFLDVVTVMNNI